MKWGHSVHESKLVEIICLLKCCTASVSEWTKKKNLRTVGNEREILPLVRNSVLLFQRYEISPECSYLLINMFIDYYYIDRKMGIFSRNRNKFHCPGQLGEK